MSEAVVRVWFLWLGAGFGQVQGDGAEKSGDTGWSEYLDTMADGFGQ